jgi:hypothetical protein
MLGRSADRLPPLRVVETSPPGVSPTAQAFINRIDGSIYLIASAPAFREVQDAQTQGRSRCGSRRARGMLASVVVHEEWHLRFGPDEKGAYQAQLMELARLGMAMTPESHSVTRSMAAVLAQKAAQHRETEKAARSHRIMTPTALFGTSPDP